MNQGSKPISVGKAEVRRHDKYYLTDGVIFLVENCLFKIPRYMLENSSPVFASMFLMPRGEKEPEGQTDAAPIHLSHTSRVDFERLMEFLYPLTIKDFFRHTDVNTSDYWISILRLAEKWQMDEIHPLAIKNIQVLLPSEHHAVQKVLLGKEFNLILWVKTGFAGLIRRHEPLTEEEAKLLGLSDAVKVAAARENIRAIHFHKNNRANALGVPSQQAGIEFKIREDEEDNYVDSPDVKQAINGLLPAPKSRPVALPTPLETSQIFKPFVPFR